MSYSLFQILSSVAMFCGTLNHFGYDVRICITKKSNELLDVVADHSQSIDDEDLSDDEPLDSISVYAEYRVPGRPARTRTVELADILNEAHSDAPESIRRFSALNFLSKIFCYNFWVFIATGGKLGWHHVFAGSPLAKVSNIMFVVTFLSS